MSPLLRDRVLLPIGIPLAALLAVEILVFPFSRVLLAVGKTPAIFVATTVALVILGVSAFIHVSPRLRSSTLIGMGVLGALLVVGGGVFALSHVEAGLETHAHNGDHAEDAASVVEVSASGNAFDTNEIHLPAGEESVIRFGHADPEPHNIAIATGPEFDEVVFPGQIIDGGEQIDYEIPPLDAGTLYFHCDVHPQMEGTVVVE